jgi:hypothetical protein
MPVRTDKSHSCLIPAVSLTSTLHPPPLAALAQAYGSLALVSAHDGDVKSPSDTSSAPRQLRRPS